MLGCSGLSPEETRRRIREVRQQGWCVVNQELEEKVSARTLALEQARQEAERLLRAAGYGPNNPLRFEFSHRNTSDNQCQP